MALLNIIALVAAIIVILIDRAGSKKDLNHEEDPLLSNPDVQRPITIERNITRNIPYLN